MKFTLAEIRWMQRGLTAITQLALPIKTSYKLAKLLNFCNQEMSAVETAREDLIKRMAVENPDKPGELRVSVENEEEFRKEFSQLLQEEVEFDFTPINISEFGEELTIAPVELASLAKVIEDQE